MKPTPYASYNPGDDSEHERQMGFDMDKCPDCGEVDVRGAHECPLRAAEEEDDG